MSYPKLAGTDATSATAPDQLFVGDSEVITDSAPALAAIAQWEVCVLLPTGITPFVPATHTTQFPDKLVVSQVAVAIGKQCPYYSAAKLNHVLLKWPAAYDTYAKRKELVQGSMIQIGHTNPPT